MSITPELVAAGLDDPLRLAAVERFKASSPPVRRIELALSRLAAELGGDPLCAATYLDRDLQHFMATSDGPADADDRAVSHCQYVIATGAWICLNDASMPVSPMVKLRRAIIRNQPIGAYLGFPLVFDDQPIGAVCAADTHSRIWTPEQHFAVYQASIVVRDLIAAA